MGSVGSVARRWVECEAEGTERSLGDFVLQFCDRFQSSFRQNRVGVCDVCFTSETDGGWDSP